MFPDHYMNIILKVPTPHAGERGGWVGEMLGLIPLLKKNLLPAPAPDGGAGVPDGVPGGGFGHDGRRHPRLLPRHRVSRVLRRCQGPLNHHPGPGCPRVKIASGFLLLWST